MADLDKILQTVLELDVDSRATVAERLLQSLEDLSPAESDRLWAEELERRLASFRQGKASSRPASEVFERAKKLVG